MNYTNTLEDIFDEHVIYNTGWLLYGSKKKPESQVYKLTHCYKQLNNNIYDILIPGESLKKNFIKTIILTLSIRNKHNTEITHLNKNIDISLFQNIKPKILKNNNHITTPIFNKLNFIKSVPAEQLAEARNLIKLFNNKRSAIYSKWYQVGMCLHNIDDLLYSDWIEFSKKCSHKFDQKQCDTLWSKFKDNKFTIASLHFWAKEDNVDKYKLYMEERINKLLKKGLECSHTTLAKIILEKHKYIFKCVSIKHNIWFKYQDHRWIEIDDAYLLRILLSDDLGNEYEKLGSSKFQQMTGLDENERKNLLSEISNISRVVKNLNTNTFKNGIIKECSAIAYDPDFLTNMNENINLIGFNNGVYDLELDCFRDGCPDDNISYTVGYNYIPYNDEDEYSVEIKNFIEKLQGEPGMVEYLMRLLSTCISGSISNESFYVFTGTGANGKSKLMELMKYTLGDYFKPMDVRILTEKRGSSSGASPELADKKGIRACTLDEPNATDEINTGFMKFFTGGDEIIARALYKEPVYFKPQFKPFLLCNQLPSIKSDDDGTWRRLKVIPFNSKFLMPDDFKKKKELTINKLPKNYYIADMYLSEKIPEWKQMFMGMLINYYREYKKSGLTHPPLVTKYTDNYRKACDIYQDFMSDMVEKVDDEKLFITVKDLYESMRGWIKFNAGGKCPSPKDLRTYLHNKVAGFNKINDSLYGYIIKGDNISENGLEI